MRFLIIGAGAIGGYVGGSLAAAGHPVTFLVRPASGAALRPDGLRLISEAPAKLCSEIGSRRPVQKLRSTMDVQA